MTYFEIHKLIKERRWTELLRGLELGENELAFDSVQDIASCKAIAYSMNSDRSGRIYNFRVNKGDKKAVIIVAES